MGLTLWAHVGALDPLRIEGLGGSSLSPLPGLTLGARCSINTKLLIQFKGFSIYNLLTHTLFTPLHVFDLSVGEGSRATTRELFLKVWDNDRSRMK
ncbi:hypothetical protein CRG98_020464 [Punica granatum]|uniref:Uncharacterized protein n=1 Tax=Punica granatum TaxID=22663 RepID=A0A2I0JS11_PUNGR|nr:hypothetical protein CRG98_020464 [Punica granatum]